MKKIIFSLFIVLGFVFFISQKTFALTLLQVMAAGLSPSASFMPRPLTPMSYINPYAIQQMNSGQSAKPSEIGQGKATVFSHNEPKPDGTCTKDKGDQQNGGKSASGIHLSPEGKPGIAAVAIPSAGTGNAQYGARVEVKILKGPGTGNCMAFPLQDKGPGKKQQNEGKVIDLTGSAEFELMGKSGCKKVLPQTANGKDSDLEVQFAVIPGQSLQATDHGYPCTTLGGGSFPSF